MAQKKTKETTPHQAAEAASPVASITTRGRTFVGVIVSAKMAKTATLEFDRLHFIPKYQRYEKRRTRLKVHNPETIAAKEGDKVRVMECRKLSKTKSFIIIEKLGGDHAAN